ncbi:hypothetical protein HBB16_04525 [Pseudonocardia sp. MCCB 268]|nr:hypothetical protein [Pseudonocardia cytotoxica]
MWQRLIDAAAGTIGTVVGVRGSGRARHHRRHRRCLGGTRPGPRPDARRAPARSGGPSKKCSSPTRRCTGSR